MNHGSCIASFQSQHPKKGLEQTLQRSVMGTPSFALPFLLSPGVCCPLLSRHLTVCRETLVGTIRNVDESATGVWSLEVGNASECSRMCRMNLTAK